MDENVDPASQSGRPSRRTVVSLIGVIVLVACVGVVALRRDGLSAVGAGVETTHRNPIKVVLPFPRTITVGQSRYRVHPAATSAVSASGTWLKAWALAPSGRMSSCDEQRPSVRVVAQTARSVVVAAFDYSPTDGPQVCSFYVGDPPGVAPSPYHRFLVPLRAPLGRRTVIDAASGDVVLVVSRFRDLVPHYLPRGYVGGVQTTMSPASGFELRRAYAIGTSSIQVDSRSIWGDGAPGGTVTGVTSIHGHLARVSVDVNERCIRWYDTDALMRSVCSLTTHRRLSAATLIRIARSLH